MKISIHKKAVVEAHKLGFFVDKDGQAFSPNARKVGYIFTKIRFGHIYSVICVSLKIEGKHQKFAVHMLQAYQKFGEAIFEDRVQVRHGVLLGRAQLGCIAGVTRSLSDREEGGPT